MLSKHAIHALQARANPVRVGYLVFTLGLMLSVAGCASFTATSGPSFNRILQATKPPDSTKKILVLTVDDSLVRRILESQKEQSFSSHMPSLPVTDDYKVNPGDLIEVSIWEAPPASLFGGATLEPGSGGSSRNVIPEQMVLIDGSINVPFAGLLEVHGRTPRQIEIHIAKRLQDKANQPQVMVRVVNKSSANVTIIGEVSKTMRMPLSPRGERVLDAIAAAGGVVPPAGKTTIQLSRSGRIVSMPLDKVIQDPAQNIFLEPGDVLTALSKSLSLTVLGATGKNEELNFEAQGISLVQALGRVGGLADSRADARGVFVFRFEDPSALNEESALYPKSPEGKIPVVYQLDLGDPGAFLVAQYFPMRDRDVIYVANAQATELQKFLNILTSSVFSISRLVDLAE